MSEFYGSFKSVPFDHTGWHRTPWGTAELAVEIVPGIYRVETASHGGYWLSAERLAVFSPSDLADTFNAAGLKGWFEQDIDWARVVVQFPDEFPVLVASACAVMRWIERGRRTA